jgi:hypothetical protein
MSQNFKPGDFLIFQIESGFGLLKLLGISGSHEEPIWHLRAFNELFLDIETAEAALNSPEQLTISLNHAAITNRAFLATQVAILKSHLISEEEEATVATWRGQGTTTTDSPIRLLLGLR